MKRVIAGLGVVLSAVAAYSLLPRQAQADPLDTVTLCHFTSAPVDPGIMITVSRNVQQGHVLHGDCGAQRIVPDPDAFHCTCLPQN